MIKIKYVLILSCITLYACASTPQVSEQETVEAQDPLYSLLADAKDDVDNAYRVLAETKNAIATQTLSQEERDIAFERATEIPEGFDKKVTLENWYGPLNSLAYQIGFWTDYKIEIYRQPVDMPMVRIDFIDTPIFELYQQIRVQVGDRAMISAENGIFKIIYPELGG